MSKATTKSSAWSSLTAMQKKIIKEIIEERVKEIKRPAYRYLSYNCIDGVRKLDYTFQKLDANFDLKDAYQRKHAEMKYAQALNIAEEKRIPQPAFSLTL